MFGFSRLVMSLSAAISMNGLILLFQVSLNCIQSIRIIIGFWNMFDNCRKCQIVKILAEFEILAVTNVFISVFCRVLQNIPCLEA